MFEGNIGSNIVMILEIVEQRCMDNIKNIHENRKNPLYGLWKTLLLRMYSISRHELNAWPLLVSKF